KIEGGKAVSAAIQKVYTNFRIDNPSASTKDLIQVRRLIQKLPDCYWKKIKLKEVDQILKAILGLWTEAVASDFSAVPGERVKVTTEVINRSSVPVELKGIQFTPGIKDSSFHLLLKENIDHVIQTTITIP